MQNNGSIETVEAKVTSAAADCGINITSGAVDAIANQVKKIPPRTWIFTGLTVLAGGIVCAIFTSIASGLTMLLTIVGLVMAGVGFYRAAGDEHIRAFMGKFFPKVHLPE